MYELHMDRQLPLRKMLKKPILQNWTDLLNLTIDIICIIWHVHGQTTLLISFRSCIVKAWG